MRRPLLVSTLTALVLSCASLRPDPPEPAPPPAPRTGVAPAENPFLHAVGRDLVDGQGNKIVLRGICFGNMVWSNPATPPRDHHSEADFRYLRSLGVNAVRFYLNEALFEDAAAPGIFKDSGWEWLDQNLAWARANGIYLVLNLHVPPGGFQSHARGGALWRVKANRDRLVALWRAIAARYQSEPALAGYDLLNEPITVHGLAEWENLARRTARAIREVDPRHAIFVERTNVVMGEWNENGNGEMNLFLLDDTNVVYEFHFYKPMAFTHQGASWIAGMQEVTTRYPGRFEDSDHTSKMADRAYLERELAPYLAFGAKYQVPLYLGEFGVIRGGFEHGRGGEAWLSDVMDIALAHGVSLTYHAFHDWGFGLYPIEDARAPYDAGRNERLAELFRSKFQQP